MTAPRRGEPGSNGDIAIRVIVGLVMGALLAVAVAQILIGVATHAG